MRASLSNTYKRIASIMGKSPSVGFRSSLEQYKEDGWNLKSYRSGQTIKLHVGTTYLYEGATNDEDTLAIKMRYFTSGVYMPFERPVETVLSKEAHGVVLERYAVHSGRFWYTLLMNGTLVYAWLRADEDDIVQ
jgi:hypothetical protein